jgi:hypothetical protein
LIISIEEVQIAVLKETLFRKEEKELNVAAEICNYY